MSPDKQEDATDLSAVGSALPSQTPGLNPEDKAGLVDDELKDKVQLPSGKHEEVLESLPSNVRKRVEFLRDVQKKHDELEQKFLEERAVLEAKYQKLYEPLYSKRFEIVSGKVEAEGNIIEADEGQEEKGVPEFWLAAMKANEVLGEEIQERDEDALKYLSDIKWQRIHDPKGFRLEFIFDPNPYFKNSVLTKTYHMIEEDDPILEKAIGTEIEWYPGKCLTEKVLKKKPKSGAKNAKPITKIEKCESFFHFFNPPIIPNDEDIDEDTAEELQNQMEQDYDIGSIIRDKIIPHAVSWFTGEAIQDAIEGLSEISDDDGDEEDGDEEDEDEEDEDEDYASDDIDEAVQRIRKKNSAADSGKGQPDKPAECKQQ